MAMEKQIGDDLRLKPDNWKEKLCQNCEHLQKEEDLFCWCGFTVDLERPRCDSFKNRYNG